MYLFVVYIIHDFLLHLPRVQKKHWTWALVAQRGLKSAGLKRYYSQDYPGFPSITVTQAKINFYYIQTLVKNIYIFTVMK